MASETIYSDTEKKLLMKNRDKIVKYIYEIIIPVMREDEFIKYDFGEPYRASNYCYDDTTEYHIKIYKKKNTFYDYSGHETNQGHIAVWQKYGGPNNAFELTKNPYDIAAVLTNWYKIKEVLISEITRKNKEITNICENFVL